MSSITVLAMLLGEGFVPTEERQADVNLPATRGQQPLESVDGESVARDCDAATGCCLALDGQPSRFAGSAASAAAPDTLTPGGRMVRVDGGRIAQLLESTPIFRRIPAEDRARLVPHARVQEFRRGDQIFSEGSPSDHFYVIASGRVKVFKTTASGKDVILEIFGAGDPLGAVAVYEGWPFPASAVAIEDTTCISITRSAFFELLETYPTLVRGLLLGLTHRLIELTNRLTELTGARVEPRLARVFLKMAGDSGRPGHGGTFIPTPLSRQELADLTGTTIETAIRIMSRWGKQGIVVTAADGFVLLDVHALEALAEL